MSTNRNLITSPVGDIQFMAVYRPVKNTKDNDVYSIRLAFDSEKDADFISQISDINMNKPVTAQTYRGKNAEVKALLETGKTLISAETKFEVPVYDSKGNIMDEAPMFFGDSTGKAQMIVQPYHSDKGGTINLTAVIIHELDTPESGEAVDKETRLAQLNDLVKKTVSK